MEAPQDDEPSTAPEETPEDAAEGEQGEETPEAVEENKKSMSKDVEEDGGVGAAAEAEEDEGATAEAEADVADGESVEQAETGAAAPPEGSQADSSSPGEFESMTKEQLIQELRIMRQEHSEQMNAEERARSELEDMLLRIEKHFKAEKAARQKAEELMQQAIENELSLKSQMDDDQQRFKDVDQALDGDREELRQERDALELMRIDFEQELHQARQEVAKSQDALKTAEDRVRSAEMIERQKLIADYEQRIQNMTSDMLRMRDEMQQRTMYMQREMQRYQAAALATAQSMAMAKKEVQERRREIDATRSKMDSLMERLQAGNEQNATLQNSILSGQDHAGQLFTDNFAMGMSGMMGMGGIDPATMMGMMAPLTVPSKGGFQPMKSHPLKTKQIAEYLPPIQAKDAARSKQQATAAKNSRTGPPAKKRT